MLDKKPKLNPKLKADKSAGTFEINATTTLHGIPAAAWEYKLGNRSDLEWVVARWVARAPASFRNASGVQGFRRGGGLVLT